MSEPIELIYNELVAEEKLKAGTKYERLAAIVFKILNTEESVIHDLRLTGDGLETAHQIDVHVRRGDKELRWLVECRDFEANARSPKIGLGEVRDFASVVRDLMPDEAMMLTTVGFTSGAETYAREQKIRLAILREFRDVSDWEGRFRELRVKGTLQGPSDLKITNWLVVDDEERRRVRPLLEAAGSWEEQRVTDTHSEYFLDSEGEPEATLAEVLDPIYLDIQKSLTPGVNTGTAMLDRTRHLRFGTVLVALRGFDWEVELFTWTHEWASRVGDGLAKLLLRTLDGEIDQAIFARDIVAWEISDKGEVAQRRRTH
ncbi:MAG TPA: restriction endonuclease [Solirubrobacterales bacterium]|nr:restriction endonuclease [Solirubrobacterales bacterium]